MRELFNLEEFTRTFWCLFWWLGIFQIQEPEYEISDEGLKKKTATATPKPETSRGTEWLSTE